MLVTCRTALLAFALAGSVAARASAQGWIEPIRPLPRGSIERIRSAVQVAVAGRIARVTVEEWFRNTGPGLGEGTYLYPLPGEAVFSDFSLWQGDRELKGETMDATQARGIYETIVRQKRDPALIELAGHGLLRARVFPINPGETRKITLRYTQILDRAGDAWRFRYVGGPSGSAASRSFRLEVDSAARFGEPYSPTHRVSVTRSGGGLAVTLADSSWSGDLDLLLPLARGLVGMSLLTQQSLGEDGSFMLLLAPGQAAQAVTLRRDLVAVLDVSGSMSGEKLDQAKAALVQLLSTLRPSDRFRVITFSSDVRRYAPAWTDAAGEHVRDAQQWVRALSAEGGTNIAAALGEAFAAAPAEGALGVVVFLTDGMPTVGETDPERIANAAEQNRGAFRVFCFGIGYDVNTYVLDRLTERARGTTEYIQPGGDIERAVGSLAAKVSSPVLTDLALRADGADLYDVQPGSLPDLFAGDELVVFGRFRGVGRGEWGVAVTGRRNGHEERFATSAAATPQSGADYIPQLWAARKVGALTREIRLHGQNPEIMNELKRLALRYGILTEYTSYLVQEPNQVVVRPPFDRIAPAPAAQVGALSVDRARREAKSAAVANAAEAADMDEAVRGRLAGQASRRVGGHLFVRRDSVWTDVAHGDSLPVVRVAAFSDAYFALLRALPELVKPAALEPAVLVAGRRVSIKIEPGGKSTWQDGELERLVREFRG